MPDATPTSIDPPSPARRNRLWTAVQAVFAIAALIYVGRALYRQWHDYANTPLHVDLHWSYLLASAVVVVAMYALLIQVWRLILREWSTSLPFGDAVRIWSVSNLGKYIPGKVWQILAMGKLAERVNVPPAAAAGSAILNTVVNIAVGLAIGVIAGFRALNQVFNGRGALGVGFSILAICGVLLLPAILPRLTAVASRMTGKNIDLGVLPRRAIYIAIVGNIAAWLLYGWSFQLLIHGVLGSAQGRFTDYVAAWALSYVIGYLVFFVPGGLGARDATLAVTLQAFGLADLKQAAVIVVVSRLGLTILEVIPGLFYLPGSTRTGTSGPTPRNGSNP